MAAQGTWKLTAWVACAIIGLGCDAAALASQAPGKAALVPHVAITAEADGAPGSAKGAEGTGGPLLARSGQVRLLGDEEARAGSDKSDLAEASSPFAIEHQPRAARSVFWIPLVSFLLPGFDQWWEGQYGYAAFYSATATSGYLFASYANRRYDLEERTREKELAYDAKKARGESVDDDDKVLGAEEAGVRDQQLGLQLAQWAGGMSAWHSFRTAARTQKQYGRYEFLRTEETPLEVMAAPFNFRYLANPATYIPLSIGLGLAALQVQVNSTPDSDMERNSLSRADAFFTAATSYNAGTHEEAVFRGWIMPVLFESWNSPFWSNAAQSLLFAAAHLGTNSMPLPQLLLGYHFGSVTMSRDWRIGESVFIHVWWDVIAFAGSYQWAKKGKDPAEVKRRMARVPPLMLPPLEWHF